MRHSVYQGVGLALCVFLSVTFSFAQTSGDYRSIADGDWSITTNWERFDGAIWATPGALGYPGQFDTPETVTIRNNHDLLLDVTPPLNVNNLVVGGGSSGSFATSAAASLMVVGDLTISTGANFLFSNTGNLIVNGDTQVNGFFQSSTTGNTIFTGMVTNAGAWNTTAITTQNKMIFNGGLTNGSTFNAGGIRLAAGRTLTANSLTNVNSGLNSPGDLTIAGTSAVVVANDVSTIGRDLIVQGSITFSGSDPAGVLLVTRNLVVDGTLVLNSPTEGNMDIQGTTTINGNFIDVQNSGIDNFNGKVTVAATGNWNTTSVTAEANMIFEDGITNDGNFSAGGASFNTRDQSIDGTSALIFSNTVTVAYQKILTNNGIVTISNSAPESLTGTGTFVQGANSVLNYAGGSSNIITLQADQTGNTVNYNGSADQTIFNTTGGEYYNLQVSNSGIKSLSSNFLVHGSVTITDAAVLKSDGSDLSLGGDWINYSTAPDPFEQESRSVRFVGTTQQRIINTGSALGTNFFNLELNNSNTTSPQFVLNTNVTVDNLITITKGNTDLNTYTLSLGISPVFFGSLSRTSGWLYNGTFTRQCPAGAFNGLFPMGSATNTRPFNIQTTSAPTTGGTITLTYTDSPYTNYIVPSFMDGAYEVLLRHEAQWNVSTTDVAGGVFSLMGGGTGFGVINNLSDLRLILQTSAVGTAGANGGTTANPQVTRTGVTLANLNNSFHIGSGDPTDSPLPVSLLFFKAAGEGHQVYLTWETATETDNAFFTIERSRDAKSFYTVGTVDGKGTTSVASRYSLWDNEPYAGRSYYRLKQTDIDGKETYFAVATVNLKMAEREFFSLYPVPSSGEVFVDLKGMETGRELFVRIYTDQGREIYSLQNFKIETNAPLSLNAGGELSPGIYLVRISSGLDVRVQKMVIR
ncbi:T9SS type A sorting domain-containing protein [Chryseolinea lacunae]|uniref:T9SS type A sorting domain-containing protein n=1 Tax=Chryseolinea lacunae TaxID=2801331 RepID=A0ABS1KRV4_9BACT|nr:T9SS type A sorting domain-containing protein [Chryseolinea lacunae]MBL0742186.1 T9SS type A sorting domain-containing protein [Chryseolinea lacunae]